MSEPICSWCGHKKSEHGRVTSACLVANCQCYEWHNPPTAPAPTTGATYAKGDLVYVGPWPVLSDDHEGYWLLDGGDGYTLGVPALVAHEDAITPAASVPDAETRAAMRLVVTLASAAKRLSSPLRDSERAEVYDAMWRAQDAVTPAHLARLTAWLAAQEGTDGR